MLILTRGLGDVIRIGDQIKIVVMGVARGAVRIGIDAPASVPIHREEVFYQLKSESRLPKTNQDDGAGDSYPENTESNKANIRYKKSRRLGMKD